MDMLLITPAGLERMTAELERLTTAGREEIARRLSEAIAGEANGSETAEYRDLCDERALLERRIGLLEERIATVRLADPGEANGIVDVGERVRLRDLDSGERLRLELVGPYEADPFANRVSIASPIGRALLGLRRGEVAFVDAPRGQRRLRVVAVEEARAADAV